MNSHSPYAPYRPPGSGRTVWIWALVGGVVLLLGAAMAWAFYVQATAARTDETTLCDTRGPTAVTALLLDATDPINELQRDAIENRLNRLLGGLKANERLDVYGIGPEQGVLRPVFSKCRPLSPDEVSEATANKRVAQQRFEDQFRGQLRIQLDALLRAAPAEQSPIMEAVQAVSVRSLRASDLRDSAPGFRRQLVLVSDLIENGEAGSHYGGVPDFGAYKAGPEFDRFNSDLRDVQVTVLYLRRLGQERVQGNAHWEFWEDWFGAQDADVQQAIPIEG